MPLDCSWCYKTTGKMASTIDKIGSTMVNVGNSIERIRFCSGDLFE